MTQRWYNILRAERKRPQSQPSAFKRRDWERCHFQSHPLSSLQHWDLNPAVQELSPKFVSHQTLMIIVERTHETSMFAYIRVCVLTCLSDVSIRMDPSSNARAMGMFVEAVEGGNKVVTGNVLKQNTSWTWILRSRSWRKTWMRFFRQITINKILVGN